MKMNNKGKSNYDESIVSNSNLVNVIQIPLQSSFNSQLEVLNNDNYIILR